MNHTKYAVASSALICLLLSFCSNSRVTKDFNGSFADAKTGQISFAAQVISVDEDSVRVRNISTGEPITMFGRTESINGASGTVTATAGPDGLSLKSFKADLDLQDFGIIQSVDASNSGLYITTDKYGRHPLNVTDAVNSPIYVGSRAFGNRDGITLIK